MLHVYLRGRVYGAEHVPQQGPLLVVSNHASYFDPPILSSCIGRPVRTWQSQSCFTSHFEASDSIVWRLSGESKPQTEVPFSAQVSRRWVGYRCFLARHSHTRWTDHRPKLGAALIAAKASTTTGLWGTEGILKKGSAMPQPAPVTVRIGEVIDAPSSTERENLQL